MISTTQDLQTFISALQGGKLLPPRLLTQMRDPHPKSAGLFGSYGLGMYVQDTGSDCVGILLNHDGSAPGATGRSCTARPTAA